MIADRFLLMRFARFALPFHQKPQCQSASRGLDVNGFREDYFRAMAIKHYEAPEFVSCGCSGRHLLSDLARLQVGMRLRINHARNLV